MSIQGPHAVSLLLLAALGCGPGRPDNPPTGPASQEGLVTLRTGATTYRAGDKVGLTIASQDVEPRYYNACTRSLEVKFGSLWVPGPVSFRMCTREVFDVQPGATRRDTTDLDIGLEPAEYRIVLGFSRVGEPDDQVLLVATNPFTIE